MRHTSLFTMCFISAFALAACEKGGKTDVNRTLKDLNVIDETNLSGIMLTIADPGEAVAYFQKSSADNPDRIDLQRGLAMSLVRAKRNTQAVAAWTKVLTYKDSDNSDHVGLVDALIRSNEWKKAKVELDRIPPTYETYKRYRLEAMVADSNKQWKRADSFYETAMGLTTNPSSVLNNWGYSKLVRGSYKDAERMFTEALAYDKTRFTSKNNLILARGAQRIYTLPVISMSQVERAQLLHTLALSAIKQGDVLTGKSLLKDAINTHPQHFEAAVRALEALENNTES